MKESGSFEAAEAEAENGITMAVGERLGECPGGAEIDSETRSTLECNEGDAENGATMAVGERLGKCPGARRSTRRVDRRLGANWGVGALMK